MGEYTFTISDTYGDGICCSYGNGSYSLIVDGSLVKSGGQFASSDDYTFGSCSGEPPVTQNPTSQPTELPTKNPTPQPTNQPITLNPTKIPTRQSTNTPSAVTSDSPSMMPSSEPSISPSDAPSAAPSSVTSDSPSMMPSSQPSMSIDSITTNSPTQSNSPIHSLTNSPTSFSTNQPSSLNNPHDQPTTAIQLTDTPTTVQPTYMPTANPTITPEATTLRTLVCGMNNKCSVNDQTAEKNTVHAVRCCRDESHGGSGGWPFKCRSDSQATYSSFSGPWAQSKLDTIPDNLIGSSNGLNYKCVETDFEGAVETCAANNARLCTPQEISDRCTRGTGCNFNSRLVWTCIAGGDGCTSDAECCSGTCGADGTCA